MVFTQLPGNGVVSYDSLLGVLTYSPDSNWSGQDQLSYVVYDNGGNASGSALVTLSVLSCE